MKEIKNNEEIILKRKLMINKFNEEINEFNDVTKNIAKRQEQIILEQAKKVEQITLLKNEYFKLRQIYVNEAKSNAEIKNKLSKEIIKYKEQLYNNTKIIKLLNRRSSIESLHKKLYIRNIGRNHEALNQTYITAFMVHCLKYRGCCFVLSLL